MGAGVQHFLAFVIVARHGIGIHQAAAADGRGVVALAAMISGKVVVAAALGVSGHHVETLALVGVGQAARPIVRIEQVIAVSARVDLILVRDIAGAVVGQRPAYAKTAGFTGFEDVLDRQRLHLYRAADGPGRRRAQARSLVYRDTADQVRVNIGALRGARVTAIDIQRLLAAVDFDRHPALALDTPDVDLHTAAIAPVGRVYTGNTGQHVRVGASTKTLQLFEVSAHGGSRGVEVFERIGLCFADDVGGIEFQSAGVLRLFFDVHLALVVDMGNQTAAHQQLAQGLGWRILALQTRRRLTGSESGVHGQQQPGNVGELVERLVQRARGDVVLTNHLNTGCGVRHAR